MRNVQTEDKKRRGDWFLKVQCLRLSETMEIVSQHPVYGMWFNLEHSEHGKGVLTIGIERAVIQRNKSYGE
jgi:hypothetical protein